MKSNKTQRGAIVRNIYTLTPHINYARDRNLDFRLSIMLHQKLEKEILYYFNARQPKTHEILYSSHF